MKEVASTKSLKRYIATATYLCIIVKEMLQMLSINNPKSRDVIYGRPFRCDFDEAVFCDINVFVFLSFIF